MDGLRISLLLAVLGTACQPTDADLAEASKRDELTKNCLARVEQKRIAGASDELASLMAKGELEPEECESHGAQLESIQIAESLLADDMPEELGEGVSR